MRKITGLVISAGLSGRMGKFKPLLEFDNKTFLEHIILKLDKICSRIIIVTGYRNDLAKKEIVNRLSICNQEVLGKIAWQYNPEYKKGMLTSLQAGLKTVEDAEWVLYHFVDQPNIPTDFYNKFAAQADRSFDWIQPCYSGKSGHPILISQKLIPAILNLNTEQSLRDLETIMQVNRTYWNCNYKEILQDFDTPEQLEQLIQEN